MLRMCQVSVQSLGLVRIAFLPPSSGPGYRLNGEANCCTRFHRHNVASGSSTNLVMLLSTNDTPSKRPGAVPACVVSLSLISQKLLLFQQLWEYNFVRIWGLAVNEHGDPSYNRTVRTELIA